MGNSPPCNPAALRLDEAAKSAGVSVGKLRKDIRDGLLEARKLGRCTVVLRLEPFNLRNEEVGQ